MPLHHELAGLAVRELHERASAAGIHADRLEEALDEEDSKAALVALILEQATTLDVAALRAMKKPELRAHAAEKGVPPDKIKAARLEDDEKEAVLRLIFAHADAAQTGQLTEALQDER